MGFFGNNKDAADAAAVAASMEENQEQEVMETQEEAPEEATPKRKPFALWEVGGKTYKLKLRTPAIVELEQKYKTNLMNIMGSGQGGMPALSVKHSRMAQSMSMMLRYL